MWTLGSASLVFTGFGDRLLSEVKKLAPKDVKIKVRFQGTPWGMGILGNLDWARKGHMPPPDTLSQLYPASSLALFGCSHYSQLMHLLSGLGPWGKGSQG